MSIDAKTVKTLRERTGAGMMECKKALVETEGDLDKAIELMRKKGMANADKKAGRVASDGRIAICCEGQKASVVEINSETDFVAKGDDFIAFCESVTALALKDHATDVQKLSESTLPNGQTVEEARKALIAKLGENMNVRRVACLSTEHTLAQYNHGSRIGVVVAFKGGDAALGKDIAMHIAASRPSAINEEGVDPALIAQEKDIFTAQAKDSGKPDEILKKMVQGRIQKFLKEITLVHQPFVKDPDVSVQQLLKQKNAEVLDFVRFEVGEGIDKKTDDFASEVAAQVAAVRS